MGLFGRRNENRAAEVYLEDPLLADILAGGSANCHNRDKQYGDYLFHIHNTSLCYRCHHDTVSADAKSSSSCN